jgi:Ca-activated chloride channel family protein
MIMKAILSLSLIMLFTVTLSLAQQPFGIFKGKITNQEAQPIANAVVVLKNIQSSKTFSTRSNKEGLFKFEAVLPGMYECKVGINGYEAFKKNKVEIIANKTTSLNVTLNREIVELPDFISEEADYEVEQTTVKRKDFATAKSSVPMNGMYMPNSNQDAIYHNTESYNSIEENGYKLTATSPLSTFSVDVDAASYANVRRFILSGNKPEKGAVRVEEMINYFQYDYPNPTNDDPFSITTEVGDCPWSKNKLVHIGLQGKRIQKENLPASNLVFLLDVSGSMNQPNKLPLLKKSFQMLVNELGDKDKIAIVVYAGAAGVVLESTYANNSTKILEALEGLSAGGSTAGGQGIELAYKVAQDNFIKGGNNRVILATDGDFNIGMSSDDAMENLIVKKRETGIFLTCLGFGTGNFKDSKMEALADKGNGNYAYIDNILEAKKVLVTEMGATLLTIAKDVKIQVEFNPALISSYRLIGYENRMLAAEDFNDDKKDAGEIGAGHSVTALYEVVLKGTEIESELPIVDPLKYQEELKEKSKFGNELLTVKFRYKNPDGEVSKLIVRSLDNDFTEWSKLSNNFKFSAAVAGFGMLLRESDYKGTILFDRVIEIASQSKGADLNGFRSEFIQLVRAAKVVYQ